MIFIMHYIISIIQSIKLWISLSVMTDCFQYLYLFLMLKLVSTEGFDHLNTVLSFKASSYSISKQILLKCIN